MPEPVLRMRIIPPRRERRLAGQAAKDEDAGIGRDDGREGVLAGQRRAIVWIGAESGAFSASAREAISTSSCPIA
jgi:hypothetical protein